MKKKIMTGDIFNNFKCLIPDTGKRRKEGKIIGLWQCLYCLREKELTNRCVTSGITKSCGCINHRKGNQSSRFTGFQEIHGKHIGRIKRSAKKRNLLYEVSNKYLWDLFLEQNKKCALCGDSIFFGVVSTASLDRIDSSKGYIEENTQWVCCECNLRKSNYSQEDTIAWARKIVKKFEIT